MAIFHSYVSLLEGTEKKKWKTTGVTRITYTEHARRKTVTVTRMAGSWEAVCEYEPVTVTALKTLKLVYND